MAKALSVEALMRDIPVAELLRRLIQEFLEREGRYTVVEREATDDDNG